MLGTMSRRPTAGATVSAHGSLYSTAVQIKPGAVLSFYGMHATPLAAALNPGGSDPDVFEIEFDIGNTDKMPAKPRNLFRAKNYMSDEKAASNGVPKQRYFRMVVSNVSHRKALMDFVLECAGKFMSAYSIYGPVKYLDGHSCYEAAMSSYGFYALTNPGYDARDPEAGDQPAFEDVLKLVFGVGADTPFTHEGVSYDEYAVLDGMDPSASRVIYAVKRK